MILNDCRIENFNGLRFYEKDVLYDNYVFTEDIEINLNVTYITPGFGIVLVDNEGYSIKERQGSYLFKIGYKEASIYYSFNGKTTLQKQVTCIDAITIQENMILKFIKKGKKVTLKLNEKIVFEEYINKDMDKYTIGYYSNQGNIIKNIAIKSNTPDNWIINMKNTQGGYIKFSSDSFELSNCKNNAEIEQSKIPLKAGVYYLKIDLTDVNNINDIKYYVHRFDDNRLFDDEKDLLSSNNSFVLLEDTLVNLKFTGKQGKVSNIMITSNEDDSYIPTTSDILNFDGSQIDIFIKNLNKVTWKGAIYRTPKYNKNSIYSLIMDNKTNIKPQDVPIKIDKESYYDYEFNVNNYTFYVYENNKTIFSKQLSNISNKITIFKNIDAYMSEFILHKKNGEVVNINVQDENIKYVNAEINSPIIVVDQYSSPFNLSSSYRKSFLDSDKFKYIFTNWEREYFYPDKNLKLTNKMIKKDDSIIIYGLKSDVNLDKIYDIKNDNINSIDLLTTDYDCISELDLLHIDKIDGIVKLTNEQISKYKMFVIDYLKEDSYCINYDYQKKSYVVNISTSKEKTKIVYNSSTIVDDVIQVNDYKITNINKNINGYIVLRKGGE